jgi:glycosyltransferase involved in cell wall biosynthesis
MDDWPAVTYSSGVIGPFARRTILAEFRRVLAEASVRMVISPAMAVEYSRRYGGAFLPFQNALDMHEWDRTARTTWNVSHPSIVRYVGSILPQAQQTSLRDVCDAIAELRDEGFDMTLAVHAQAEHTEPLRSWGFDAAVLRIEPAPNPADVPRLLATADVLVLPTNFDDASVRYVRLSLPTKVPAYMASGTPVLVYGRSDVATVQYAQTSGWGLAVTERDRTSIKTALRRLMTDIELRHTIGRRAMAVAHQNHDVLRVRSNFWDALASATASRAGVGM